MYDSVQFQWKCNHLTVTTYVNTLNTGEYGKII